MVANDFQKICRLVQQGKEELVNHPQSHEDGQVLACEGNALVVKTEEGRKVRWRFDECHEIHQHRDDYRFN